MPFKICMFAGSVCRIHRMGDVHRRRVFTVNSASSLRLVKRAAVPVAAVGAVGGAAPAAAAVAGAVAGAPTTGAVAAPAATGALPMTTTKINKSILNWTTDNGLKLKDYLRPIPAKPIWRVEQPCGPLSHDLISLPKIIVREKLGFDWKLAAELVSKHPPSEFFNEELNFIYETGFKLAGKVAHYTFPSNLYNQKMESSHYFRIPKTYLKLLNCGYLDGDPVSLPLSKWQQLMQLCPGVEIDVRKTRNRVTLGRQGCLSVLQLIRKARLQQLVEIEERLGKANGLLVVYAFIVIYMKIAMDLQRVCPNSTLVELMKESQFRPLRTEQYGTIDDFCQIKQFVLRNHDKLKFFPVPVDRKFDNPGRALQKKLPDNVFMLIPMDYLVKNQHDLINLFWFKGPLGLGQAIIASSLATLWKRYKKRSWIIEPENAPGRPTSADGRNIIRQVERRFMLLYAEIVEQYFGNVMAREISCNFGSQAKKTYIDVPNVDKAQRLANVFMRLATKKPIPNFDVRELQKNILKQIYNERYVFNYTTDPNVLKSVIAEVINQIFGLERSPKNQLHICAHFREKFDFRTTNYEPIKIDDYWYSRLTMSDCPDIFKQDHITGNDYLDLVKPLFIKFDMRLRDPIKSIKYDKMTINLSRFRKRRVPWLHRIYASILFFLASRVVEIQTKRFHTCNGPCGDSLCERGLPSQYYKLTGIVVQLLYALLGRTGAETVYATKADGRRGPPPFCDITERPPAATTLPRN